MEKNEKRLKAENEEITACIKTDVTETLGRAFISYCRNNVFNISGITNIMENNPFEFVSSLINVIEENKDISSIILNDEIEALKTYAFNLELTYAKYDIKNHEFRFGFRNKNYEGKDESKISRWISVFVFDNEFNYDTDLENVEINMSVVEQGDAFDEPEHPVSRVFSCQFEAYDDNYTRSSTLGEKLEELIKEYISKTYLQTIGSLSNKDIVSIRSLALDITKIIITTLNNDISVDISY
jgi:hypothetical protein